MVPINSSTSIGRMALSADAVVAPIRIVFVFRSSTLAAGAVCQTQVTCGSCSGVPIQEKFARSNLTLLPSGDSSFKPRLERHVAGRHADHGAVTLGDIVEIIGDDQPGGARHVLDDDGGIAGDVPAVVIGQRAGGDVVAARRRAGDRKLDGLAAIKVRDRFGACRRHEQQHGPKERNAEMSRARHAAASASEASSRPWPLIGSLMPSALKAAKKLACE